MSSAQVPEGYKQTEIGVIPEDWHIKTLGEISNFTNGKAHENHINEFGKYIVVNSKFISSNAGVKKYSDICLCKTSKNNILMVMSDIPNGKAIAKCFFVDNDHIYTVNQRICSLEITTENSVYIFYELNRNPFYLQFDDGVKQTNLRRDEVLSCPLPIPPLPEQRAIAQALSDVDSLTASLDKLIAKQRQLKIAAMQQLLTGKMRLPGFGVGMGYKQTEIGLIPEDWEVYHLETLASQPIQNGVFTDPTRKGNGCKLINVGDLYSSIPINSGKLEFFDANQDEIKRFGVFQGDIFFTRSSLTPDGIAHCNIYTEAEASVVFDCHLIRFRPNANLISPQFFFRYCATVEARKYLVANSKTTTMTTIDQGVISKLPIPVPSLEEQHVIATVLSDMDTAITALETRRTKTQAIKQGMMQELLTGRIRLTQ